VSPCDPHSGKKYRCGICRTPLRHSWIDLGMSPLANSYRKVEDLNQIESFYPLHVYVCEQCYQVQLPPLIQPERLFSDYPYFSSFSVSWLEHGRKYVDQMVERFTLGSGSQVIEIGSNDGYLLRHFQARGVPVLGIESATNVAAAAQASGIPTMVQFFGPDLAVQLAHGGVQAKLLVINNILAHVPDLHGFVRGLKVLLQPNGVITAEFPHLMRIIADNQFDTIYHEHVYYFSFITVRRLLAEHDLTIFDVQELPTHGGSLRIFVCHQEDRTKPVAASVDRLRDRELAAGFTRLEFYDSFREKVLAAKRGLLSFLIEVREKGQRIVGYGAPAKATTLLNFCGIRQDWLSFTVDQNPHKQGHYVPGTHIPIQHPDRIREVRPDYLLILPWNLRDEIMEQMAYIRKWGGRFVTPIPEVRVYP
jgi:hypothetical protein